MLNPQDRPAMNHKKSQQQEEREIYKTTVLGLQAALQKLPQHRSQSEHQSISEFLNISAYFKEVSEQISSDFARNIVKKSKIYFVHGKKKVYQTGEPMQVIFMPLLGDIFVRNKLKNKSKGSGNDLKEIFDPMVASIKKTTVQQKSTLFLEKRSSLGSDFRVTAVPHWQDLTNMEPLEGQGTLMLETLESQKYSEGIYVKSEGWFLGIQLKRFKQCLLQEYDRRIMEEASYFRNIRCFGVLGDQQLKTFIQKIRVVEFKKDQYIYRQGDISQHLYLLIEGEAKASKVAALFKEDPNSLYQRTVKSQSSRRPQQVQLSYVNFEGVYNYSPQIRRIQLGILSPVTIFGDEEISTSFLALRQTEVQVTSYKLKAYKFTLKELESSGNGKKIDVSKFMSDLFDFITEKRIMKRRESLRSSLELQNRRSMNYFFLDGSTSPQKRSRSSRDKINSSIYQGPPKSQRPRSAVKPRYHNLNFNQFVEQDHRCQAPAREVGLSLQEKKISKLTHNSFEIVQKVQKQLTMFTKLQGYRHQINIETPLFDSNYYKKQRKEVLRIENKRRMNKIEVVGAMMNRSRGKNSQN